MWFANLKGSYAVRSFDDLNIMAPHVLDQQKSREKETNTHTVKKKRKSNPTSNKRIRRALMYIVELIGDEPVEIPPRVFLQYT